MSVAATCALLDWELRPDGEMRKPGAVVVWERPDGRIWVVVLGEDGKRREYNVSRATFDFASLLKVRGVPALDVGPCEECEARGGGWEWRQDICARHPGDGEYADPERWAEELARRGWTHGSAWRWPEWEILLYVVAKRPCPACDVDGKPTGRHRVPAFEAVLMGEPRERDTVVGWNGDRPEVDDGALAMRSVAEIAASHGQTLVEVLRSEITVEEGERNRCVYYRVREPGHEGARAALRKLAEGWERLADGMPERSASVMLDRAETKGDATAQGLLFARPPGAQPYADPCPELGAWVLAWLAGLDRKPCPEWNRGYSAYGHVLSGCELCKFDGPKPGYARHHPLGPHLSAIRAHLAKAWQRTTVECRACEGQRAVQDDDYGGYTPVPWETYLGSRRRSRGIVGQTLGLYAAPRPCPECAGLGRVKP